MKLKLSRITWVTTLLTLAPMILGVAVYQKLPGQIASHFGVNGQPNQYASKPMVLFGIPILMALLQLFLMVMYAWNVKGKGRAKRLEPVLFNIIPVISIVLYLTTIGFALGVQLDIRRIVVFLVAIIFISVGNYLPTVTYEQQKGLHHGGPRPKSPEKWAKVSRMAGYSMVASGGLMLLSLFFNPVISVIVLIVAIAMSLIGVGWAAAK